MRHLNSALVYIMLGIGITLGGESVFAQATGCAALSPAGGWTANSGQCFPTYACTAPFTAQSTGCVAPTLCGSNDNLFEKSYCPAPYVGTGTLSGPTASCPGTAPTASCTLAVHCDTYYSPNSSGGCSYSGPNNPTISSVALATTPSQNIASFKLLGSGFVNLIKADGVLISCSTGGGANGVITASSPTEVDFIVPQTVPFYIPYGIS